MNIRLAALGALVLLVAVLGVGSALAQGGTVVVTMQSNDAADAGCLVGDITVPVGDFGAIVPDAVGWAGSETVEVTIPLGQDLAPGAIDCRLEIAASDLTVAGSPDPIPAGHLVLAGCDLDPGVSLGTPRAMTCAVDAGTTGVGVSISLAGLDQPPTGALSGTITISGTNGT